MSIHIETACHGGHLPQGRCGLKFGKVSGKYEFVPRHLPQGRCGLKSDNESVRLSTTSSPSARKVWIEISLSPFPSTYCTSPSARKVWIEIKKQRQSSSTEESPSARKVWIEINGPEQTAVGRFVTFHKEGVD